MNPSQNSRQFERDRDGRLISASRRWARALRNALAGRSGIRRASRAGSGLTESLEVRQVLSAANPMMAMMADSIQDPLVIEDPPQDLATDTVELSSVHEDFLTNLQMEIASAFATAGLAQGNAPRVSLSTPGAAGFDAGDAWPTGVSTLDVPDAFGTALKPGIAAGVVVRFDWNEGPQSVVVSGSSETIIQITVQGLGSSALAAGDRDAAEQLLQGTTRASVQSYLSVQTAQITFQTYSSLQSEPSGYLLNQVEPSETFVRSSASNKADDVSQALVPLSSSVTSNLSIDTPAVETDSTPLIDEVFGDTIAILDGTPLLPPIVSAVGDADVESKPLPLSDNGAGPVSIQPTANIFVLPPQTHNLVPSSVAGIDWPHCRITGTLSETEWRWSQSHRSSSRGFGGGLPNSERTFVSRLLDRDFVVGAMTWSETVERSEQWIEWLTARSASTSILDHLAPQSSLSAKPVPDPVTAQTQFSQRGNVPELRLVSSSTPQTQSRKLRASLRISSSPDRMEWVLPHEFEPPQLLRLDTLPNQSRYVTNPRGPPVYGRDANVPLFDTEAPADLLERLRYSIAPRGPSLVTVEMQSPEFLSFSGPRVSSEEFALKLAC